MQHRHHPPKQVKGKKASPDEAPIVVSNHISFVETVYLPSRLLGMAVSRVENSYYPVRARGCKSAPRPPIHTFVLNTTD